MSEQRKLFTEADEFDFKRKFVIAYLAGLSTTSDVATADYVQSVYETADKWWQAIVNEADNDGKPQ